MSKIIDLLDTVSCQSILILKIITQYYITVGYYAKMITGIFRSEKKTIPCIFFACLPSYKNGNLVLGAYTIF